MKPWKKSGRSRRNLNGPQLAREAMSLEVRRKRGERNIRRDRARKIVAKRKVVPGAKEK